MLELVNATLTFGTYVYIQRRTQPFRPLSYKGMRAKIIGCLFNAVVQSVVEHDTFTPSVRPA
jgi:hypothetical protein